MTPVDCWAVFLIVFVALIVAFGMGFWLGCLWEDLDHTLEQEDD